MEWYHINMAPLAAQLSKGSLNDMKRRIEKTLIKKEKLDLSEDTTRMKEFFKREIKRYQNRKAKQKRHYEEAKKKEDRINEQKKQIDQLQDQLFKANSLLENINQDAVSTYQKSVADNENMKKLLQEKIGKISEYEILIEKGIENLRYANKINKSLRTRFSNATNENGILMTKMNQLSGRNTVLINTIKYLKKKISAFNAKTSNKIII